MALPGLWPLVLVLVAAVAAELVFGGAPGRCDRSEVF